MKMCKFKTCRILSKIIKMLDNQIAKSGLEVGPTNRSHFPGPSNFYFNSPNDLELYKASR